MAIQIQIVFRRRRWFLCVLVSLILLTTQIAAHGVDQGSSIARSVNLRGKPAQQTENGSSSIQDRQKNHDLSDLNSSWAQRQQEPIDDEQQHGVLSRSMNRALSLEVQSHETYVTNCVGYMLSRKAINDEDHIASQNDLASFIRQECVRAGICDPSDSLPFESLTVRIQRLFDGAVCDESDTYDRDKCLRNVLKVEGQYGFHIHYWDQTQIAYYQPILKDICGKIWSEAIIDPRLRDGIQESSTKPTKVPTKSPTPFPTKGKDFQVDVTYMVGLRKEISADEVVTYGYGMIDVDLRNGVASVLESSVVGPQPLGIGTRFSVENYNYKDTTCPLDSKAKACIYVSSAITILASPERRPDEVEQAVVTSLRDSMYPHDTFVEAVGNDYVIEARFGGPYFTPLPTHAPTRPPTFPPTKPPTRALTFLPSHAPTEQTIIAPIKAPTGESTKAPVPVTIPPAGSPRVSPTEGFLATHAPTEPPTKAPPGGLIKSPTKAPGTLPPPGSPTASPTDNVITTISIKYVIGLNNKSLTAEEIEYGAENITSDLQNGLANVATAENLELLEGSDGGYVFSAENLNYTDVSCPPAAAADENVLSCVSVQSVIIVTVLPDTSQEEIQARMLIQDTHLTNVERGVRWGISFTARGKNEFIDNVNNMYVVFSGFFDGHLGLNLNYIQNIGETPPDGEDSPLSGGEIAGVTVGIFFSLMLANLALKFIKRDDHEDERNQGSWVRVAVADGETTDFYFIEEVGCSVPITTAQAERNILPDAISLSQNLPGFENEAVHSVDVDALEGRGSDTFMAAKIATTATALVSGGASISDLGNSLSGDMKTKNLNKLIDHGDFDAIAAIVAMMESD